MTEQVTYKSITLKTERTDRIAGTDSVIPRNFTRYNRKKQKQKKGPNIYTRKVTAVKSTTRGERERDKKKKKIKAKKRCRKEN